MNKKAIILIALGYLILGLTCFSYFNYKKSEKYYLSIIPNKVMTRFKKDNWKIKYDENLDSTGLIEFDKKIISYKSSKSILHEFGHYIKRVCDVDVSNAYEKEKNKLKLSKYYTNNENEYFAEMFEYYLLDEKLVKEKAPKTYILIFECLDDF